MATFTNNRTNETVICDLPLSQIAAEFAATAPESHWLWYWLAKYTSDRKSASPATADMRAFLADSFLYAIGMGLKNPMIRIHYKDNRYKIYLSKRGTVCFKTGRIVPGTNNPDGDEEYMGCLFAGKFLPNKERSVRPSDQEFLDKLGADPVGFLAQTSKDMDRCCYCGKALEDKRSKDVGYGSTCADRWGLPWGKTYDEKVPSFAQLWGRSGAENQRDIRGLCDAIRKSPHDGALWGILGDALEEAGFTKRPCSPPSGVTIPAS